MTIRLRTLIAMFCLLAAAGFAGAQPRAAAPTPPAPPVPPAAPMPAPAPAVSLGYGSLNDFNQMSMDAEMKAQETLLENRDLAQAQDQMRNAGLQDVFSANRLTLEGMLAQSNTLTAQAERGLAEAYKAQALSGVFRSTASADAQYSRGQSALDARRWDEALQAFTQAASRGGERADGALYWKAYTLNKLGRRDEAVAAIAELRKSYASSRWLDDAKALELEVKQANGQPVSPESQSDDDLKLIAINGLMQSDPDRAIPTLEGLLKSAQSPKLKERALFVLAQNSSPKAQQLLEQVARGAGNPDLQVTAIQYLSTGKGNRVFVTPFGNGMNGMATYKADTQNQANHGPLLLEIYNSTNDVTVKRAILNSLSSSRDSDRLLQVVKAEKSADLRLDAVRRLTSMRNASTPDALVPVYSAEQDKGVKRAIVDSFGSQDNVKQLVAVGRAEKDPEMVRYIVTRLAGMKSPEAADFLMEILRK